MKTILVSFLAVSVTNLILLYQLKSETQLVDQWRTLAERTETNRAEWEKLTRRWMKACEDWRQLYYDK